MAHLQQVQFTWYAFVSAVYHGMDMDFVLNLSGLTGYNHIRLNSL